MSDVTVRQAVLSGIDALVSLFDGYRQFYGRTSNVVLAEVATVEETKKER